MHTNYTSMMAGFVTVDTYILAAVVEPKSGTIPHSASDCIRWLNQGGTATEKAETREQLWKNALVDVKKIDEIILHNGEVFYVKYMVYKKYNNKNKKKH